MDLFHFDPNTFFSFFLTLIRVSLLLFLLPFFGGNNIPNPVKAALCLVMSMAVWPKLAFPGMALPANIFSLSLMLLGEVILGMLLGILVQLLFSAVQAGGAIMGFCMGFSMMNIVDPMSGVSEPIVGHLLSQTTILLFLSLNGHLFLLQGLSESFTLVPPGGLFIDPHLGEHLIRFSSNLFILAIKIAAPVMVALFLVDLALALVGRAAPQMNVLFVGFPLKIGVGFLFMTMIFTALARYIGDYIVELGPMFSLVLKMSG